jgi:hypothetical protein
MVLHTTGYKSYSCNKAFLDIYYDIYSEWNIGKGKAIPVQVWTGPEGSRFSN